MKSVVRKHRQLLSYRTQGVIDLNLEIQLPWDPLMILNEVRLDLGLEPVGKDVSITHEELKVLFKEHDRIQINFILDPPGHIGIYPGDDANLVVSLDIHVLDPMLGLYSVYRSTSFNSQPRCMLYNRFFHNTLWSWGVYTV